MEGREAGKAKGIAQQWYLYIGRMQDTVIQNLMSWDSWAFWFLLGSAIAWILRHSVTLVTLQELCLCQPMWDKVREILVDTFTTRLCSCIPSAGFKASLNWCRSSHPTPKSGCQKDQAPRGGRKGLERWLERVKEDTFATKGDRATPHPSSRRGEQDPARLKLVIVWQVLWVWGTGKKGINMRKYKAEAN